MSCDWLSQADLDSILAADADLLERLLAEAGSLLGPEPQTQHEAVAKPTRCPAWRFTVPGPPVAKARPRLARNGHAFTPKSTRVYERTVALFARSAGVRPLSGPVRLCVHFFFGDRRRRDLDNCLKSVCDGLNHVAYVDDSQVAAISVTRSFDTENPRTEVAVFPMTQEF